MGSGSQAHEISEGNKDCTGNCAGSHSCNTLAKSLPVFCPCFKILSETDWRNNRQSCLVVGISSQYNMQGMAWLSPAVFNKAFGENLKQK